MSLTPEALLARIEQIEREASELILEAHDIAVHYKGARNHVTDTDSQVQALLTDRLREAVPEARFFCEEDNSQDHLDAEELFIIDPIDGTTNFVHHLNHSCISIAYMRRGEVLLGAIYNPFVDEMFTAVKGGGARLNGRPIRVTEAPLAESIACVGTAPYRDDLHSETFRLIERIFGICQDIRRQGSAALDLCSVAAGRAGLFMEQSLYLWDYAAGALIAGEAGAVCCTLSGAPLPWDDSRSPVLAGTPEAVEAFLRRERDGA